MSKIKYTIAREFIYGLDWTDFAGSNQDTIIVYDTYEEAEKELDFYAFDVDYAFIQGDMDEPYQNDCRVIEVIIKDGYASHVEIDEKIKVEQYEQSSYNS